MKIGFSTASVSRSAGGLFGAVADLAHALVGVCKDEIQVFSVRDLHTEADRAAWEGAHLNIFDSRGPRGFAYAPGLLSAMLGASLDIVHCHGLWTYASVASLTWSRRSRKPYLVAPHGMLDTWALANSGAKKRVARWLYQDAQMRRSTCLHALCTAEARSIRTLGFRNPVCVIPNGIDLPAHTAEAPAWDALLPRDIKVLLFLGRLHPKKGIANLLRGWKEATSRDSSRATEWRLVIAGWDQGGYMSKMETLSRELDIQRSVLFVGPQFGMHKNATFGRAEAFILPSLSEGLPVAVLEAWAHALPVLMTPECNLPEGYEAGASIAIRPEPCSIADGLLSLFRLSSGERRAIGARGRRLVCQRFAWPAVAGQMATVYKWIASGGPEPDCVC